MESSLKRRHSSDENVASSSRQTEAIPDTPKKRREYFQDICLNVIKETPFVAIHEAINTTEDQVPQVTLTERSVLTEVKTSAEINIPTEVSTLQEIHIQSETDSPVEIDTLNHTSTENNTPVEVETSQEYKCSICLDSSLWRKMKQLSCSHEFHEVCIESWLSKNLSCPICRKDIIGPYSSLDPLNSIVHIRNGNFLDMVRLRKKAQELQVLINQVRLNAEEVHRSTEHLRLETEQYIQTYVCTD